MNVNYLLSFLYDFRYACSLLRQGMKQISITLDAPEIVSVEKSGNKDAIAKVKKNEYFIYFAYMFKLHIKK